jgi:hypothetical protein
LSRLPGPALGARDTSKEFYDKNGNLVRLHAAGLGNALTFINLNSGASLPLKMNGYSVMVVFNPDGSQRVKASVTSC